MENGNGFLSSAGTIFKKRLDKQMEIHKDALFKINSVDYKRIRAAVLLALFEHMGKIYVLLTQRSQTVNSHPGEVCLPGGKSEKSDADVIDTALRETWEEIGLPRSNVTILGLAAPLISMHGIHVTPVVAWISRFSEIKLKKNSNEVEAIFACPLDLFLDKTCHTMFMEVSHSFMLNFHSSAGISESDCDFLRTLFLDPVNSVFRIFGLTASLLIPIAVLWYHVDFTVGNRSFDKDDAMLWNINYVSNLVSSNPSKYLCSAVSSKL